MLVVERIAVKLVPAPMSEASGVAVLVMVTIVVLETVPLADDDGVQPSVL